MKTQELQPIIIGEFKDRIIYPDGNVEERDWQRNTIVNGVGKLIACLMKNQSGYKGIGYWAIGQGSSSWDTKNPPLANQRDTQLVSEIGRKLIPTDAIKFLDGDGRETSSVTNIIKINLTFGADECNGSWREFGIVGGNANGNANTGIFINHKTHELIEKKSGTIIEREMRFTFSKGGVI